MFPFNASYTQHLDVLSLSLLVFTQALQLLSVEWKSGQQQSSYEDSQRYTEVM